MSQVNGLDNVGSFSTPRGSGGWGCAPISWLSKEVWVDGLNICCWVDISQVKGLGVCTKFLHVAL